MERSRAGLRSPPARTATRPDRCAGSRSSWAPCPPPRLCSSEKTAEAANGGRIPVGLWGRGLHHPGRLRRQQVFMDFRGWLISMGRPIYRAALDRDPESLLDVADAPGVEVIVFEDLAYVASKVYKQRRERNLPRAASSTRSNPEPGRNGPKRAICRADSRSCGRNTAPNRGRWRARGVSPSRSASCRRPTLTPPTAETTAAPGMKGPQSRPPGCR